jgi:2-keto-4-pentenoate hydratase/2-oxohepta-3-ene-1,7-dioic acid hydratase in catechol pathway
MQYDQPADHSNPECQRFQQRLTLLHTSDTAPMVLYTGGYYVSTSPSRRELTSMLGANQLSVERALKERSAGAVQALAAVKLLAPIPRPGKIIGVGLNYNDHAAEVGRPKQSIPRLFVKVSSSVVGPDAAVAIPRNVSKLDFEVELAVVIGKRATRVKEADAIGYVGGYTILNDQSAREFQFDVTPAQTSLAKSMDGFCPMGPWIVTADELGDGSGLGVRTWVNGDKMQDGTTSDLIFSVAALVAYISQYMTLEPGDVIATGTPAGVGAFRKPPLFLKSGDRVKLEIDRIGVLETKIKNAD